MRARLITPLLIAAAATSLLAGEAAPKPPIAPTSVSPCPSTRVGLPCRTGTYTYDGAGNIVSIGDGAALDTFTYDAVGRLTSANLVNEGGKQQTYTYDVFGNLTVASSTIQVDSTTNRLAPTVTSPPDIKYDAAGNLVTGFGVNYVYDAGNTLQSAKSNDSDFRYVYDADDERVGTIAPSYETVNGTVMTSATNYIATWRLRDLGQRVIREFNENSANGTPNWTWTHDYLFRDGLLLTEVLPDVAPGTEKMWHYHLDHLGSPRLITNDQGAEVSEHNFYPFGDEIPRSKVPELMFTGHERDSVAGGAQYYMHARYENTVAGRFLSVDPVIDTKRALRNPQAWNRYAYVENNPLNRTDPDGRLTIIVAGTWAKDEDWPKKGAFNQAVSQRFGEQAVAFRWSGGNTKAARAEAATQLKDFIARNLKPGEPLNIVAHSHGGNVVKAYTQMQGAQKIDTFIAMGTPQRSDYTINRANVGEYFNVFSERDHVQVHGDHWYWGPAGNAGRTDPAAVNIDVTYATGNPVGLGHSELHTPEVLNQVPPE